MTDYMFLFLVWFSILLLGIINNAYAQTLDGEIRIDGFISFSEIQDTEIWKTITNTNLLCIRESEEAFYIGITSNTYSSANIYIDNKDTIKVLHVSYSLGDINYAKGEDYYEPKDTVYTWKFIDPIIRTGETAKTHIEVNQELVDFYTANSWTANTMPIGSYRELEILISKEILPNIERLGISFLAKDHSGKSKLNFFPEGVISVTGDAELDRELQNGNVPKIKNFEIFYN